MKLNNIEFIAMNNPITHFPHIGALISPPQAGRVPGAGARLSLVSGVVGRP